MTGRWKTVCGICFKDAELCACHRPVDPRDARIRELEAQVKHLQAKVRGLQKEMEYDPQLMAEVRARLVRGQGYRQIARALRTGTGTAWNMIQRLRQQEPGLQCQCGKPVLHRSYCEYRLAQNPLMAERMAAAKPASIKRRWLRNRHK